MNPCAQEHLVEPLQHFFPTTGCLFCILALQTHILSCLLCFGRSTRLDSTSTSSRTMGSTPSHMFALFKLFRLKVCHFWTKLSACPSSNTPLSNNFKRHFISRCPSHILLVQELPTHLRLMLLSSACNDAHTSSLFNKLLRTPSLCFLP